MPKYYLVTVHKYHGVVEPELINLEIINASNIEDCRRQVIDGLAPYRSDWITLRKEELLEFVNDHDLDQIDQIIEYVIQSEEMIEKINWNSTCSCDGCCLTFKIFPETDLSISSA